MEQVQFYIRPGELFTSSFFLVSMFTLSKYTQYHLPGPHIKWHAIW